MVNLKLKIVLQKDKTVENELIFIFSELKKKNNFININKEKFKHYQYYKGNNLNV